MSMTIDECFAFIDTLNNDRDQCEQIFAQLKTQIDEYELIDETLFFSYSARFFRAKAKFNHSLNNAQDASKQEKLADLYQKKYEQRQPVVPPRNPPSVVPPATTDNIVEIDEVRKSFAHLRELFSKDDLINTNTIDTMKNLELITNDLLSTEYCQSLDSYMRLKTVANAIQRNARLLHDPLIDLMGEFLGAIDTFNITIEEYLYRQRVLFAQYLLTNPTNIYANIILLEPNIESYTRKLAALFHTDKANNNNDQTLFQNLFVEIYSQKESLLAKIQIGKSKSATVDHFRKLGHEWWYKAIDISRARKGEWEKMQHLLMDSLRNSTEIELNALQRSYACQAYEYYRTACHMLGNDGDINEQIELRKCMALSLYLADAQQFRLEAQLYAVAAVHLLVEFSTDFSLDKFNDLQKLIVKIQGNSSNTTIKQDDDTASVPLKSGEIVLHQSSTQNLASTRREIRSVVAEDKRRVILRQCLLRTTNHRIRTAEETILEAKSQATKSYVSGVAALFGSAFAAFGAVTGASTITTIAGSVAAGSVLGPAAPIVLGGLGVFSCGYTAVCLFRKSNELCEEPEIREELNRTLGEATKLYQDGDIDAFFAKLAVPYGPNTRRLLNIFLAEDHVELKVDSEWIVKNASVT